MSTQATAAGQERHAAYNKSRLFLVSVIALFTAGVGASLRANIAGDLERVFFIPLDRAHSAQMVGDITSVAFLGFALTIAIGARCWTSSEWHCYCRFPAFASSSVLSCLCSRAASLRARVFTTCSTRPVLSLGLAG